MKKGLFSLLVLSWISLNLFAAPVSSSDARAKALSFVRQAKIGTQLVQESPAKMSTKSVEAIAPAYYIYNVEGGGFVIVSGDDRTVPVLGYSDSGVCDVSRLPQNMKGWLDECAREIRSLDERGITKATPSMTKKSIAEPKKPINPLLSTKWDQYAPFYNLTPTMTYGEKTYHCFTGCIATAMAQVMYYHKWPQEATAEIPGYDSNTSLMGLAALPAYTFDWAAMKTSYSGTETEVDAVSYLLEYCCYSVKTNFGTGRSEASDSNIPNALINYFGYDDGVRRIQREDYSIDGWASIIYKELSAGRPVIYNGTSTGGGHSLVCDGYDGAGYFHFNWGWNGMCDGYFSLSILTPNASGAGASSTSDGYSMFQSAIIGIQKPDNFDNKVNIAMTASNPSVSGTTVSVNVFNLTSTTDIFNYGYAILNDDATLTVLPNTIISFGSVAPNYGINAFPTTLKASYFTGGDGSYKVVPVSMNSNSDQWLPACNPDLFHFVATVSGSDLSLSIYPQKSLADVSIHLPSQLYVYKEGEVQVTLENAGDEYSGILYLLVSTDGGSTKNFKNQTAFYLKKDATETLSLYYTPTAAGTNILYITTDLAGKNILATETVEVTNMSSSKPALNFELAVNNSISSGSGNTLYGKKIKGTLTVSSESEITTEVGVRLYEQVTNTGFTSKNNVSQVVTIPAGGSKAVPFEFDNLSYGTNYVLSYGYTYNNTNYYANLVYDNLYVPTPAIICTLADGSEIVMEGGNASIPAEAVYVNFEGLDEVSSWTVTPSANPNCFYLFDDGVTPPASLTGNVVIGSAAASIVLQDGYNFALPYAITADEVTYNRTFSHSADGTSGWSTLVLPFAATKVTNTSDDNRELTWFKNAEEKDKDLWIKSFSGDGGGSTVYFGYPSSLEANIPYLIAVSGGDASVNDGSLVGKNIQFSATNAIVSPTKNMSVTGTRYRFTGTSSAATLENVYVMNATGTAFQYGTGSINPFRAYFASDLPSLGSTLQIASFAPDAIKALSPRTKEQTVIIYTLSGVKVAQVQTVGGRIPTEGLSPGIYVAQGKKFVVK